MRYGPATQVPGPSEKTGYPGTALNEGRGVVCHSMVGYLAGAMIELNKLDRRASWHFSVLQSGEVLQHYDPAQVTWHCGSPRWNARLIGIEHEGGFNPEDEPLTDLQRDASVKLVHWLSETLGFPLERKVALWEHNEVAPPTDTTSCPSNRIPWDAYKQQEEDMKPMVVWCPDYAGGSAWLVGPFGAAWVTQPDDLAALERLYGAITVSLHAATINGIDAR